VGRKLTTRHLVLALAASALVVGCAALIVAIKANRRAGMAQALATPTTTTLATVSVPRAGTVTIGSDGRATLEVVGDVRIPIDHMGSYRWTSRSIPAPASVLNYYGRPDTAGSGYRVEGTATVGDFRSSFDGDFPTGNHVFWRVAFTVTSFTGRPFVHLEGGAISGVPKAATSHA
jgi:hypothetical protein